MICINSSGYAYLLSPLGLLLYQLNTEGAYNSVGGVRLHEWPHRAQKPLLTHILYQSTLDCDVTEKSTHCIKPVKSGSHLFQHWAYPNSPQMQRPLGIPSLPFFYGRGWQTSLSEWNLDWNLFWGGPWAKKSFYISKELEEEGKEGGGGEEGKRRNRGNGKLKRRQRRRRRTRHWM